MESETEMLEKVRAALYADLDKSHMKCDECDQRFWLKTRLERHRLIHKSCHICYEIFADKMDLNRHLLSHYELEVGPCPVCRELCTNQDELLQHLRTMHNQYLKAKDQALLEKYPHSKSSSRFTQCDIPEVLDFYGSTTTAVEVFAVQRPLKKCNPPIDDQNNATRQFPREIKKTCSSNSFIPSKQSENVQKYVSTESSCQDCMSSNPQPHISSNSTKYYLGNSSSFSSFFQSPFYFPFSYVTEKVSKEKVDLLNVENRLMKPKLKKASNDLSSRESTTQNISFNSVEKSKIIEQKGVKSQLSSINQLQNIPIISNPTARLPKVIIGEILNNFQKLNTPKDINAFVPVNSDINVFQHSLSNRKVVKVSTKCMKVLKESLLKDSPDTNSKLIYVTVPPQMLKQLEVLPSKSEPVKNVKSVSRTSTTTFVKRKESDVINQTNIEKILQEDRRRKEEKEKIKKKEKIIRKMLLKYEEKEEKKLIKYFQKTVASRIERKQGHLNEIDKKLVDAMENKTLLLELIRYLKCRDQNDVGRLLEYFGGKYTTGKKQAVCRRDRKVAEKGRVKPVENSIVSKIEDKVNVNWKGRERKFSMPKYVNPSVSNNIFGRKSVKEESEEIFNIFGQEKVGSTLEREDNLAHKSESPYLFNSHKTIPFNGDPFTDMSIITDETYTIACPCGVVNCVGFHSD